MKFSSCFSKVAIGFIARYVEARTMLGQMVNLSRELASRLTAPEPRDAAHAAAQVCHYVYNPYCS